MSQDGARRDAAFPYERLAADLARVEHSTYALARLTGLAWQTVSALRRGRRRGRAPLARTVARLLPFLGDPSSYLAFAESPRGAFVCTTCPRVRVVAAYELRKYLRRHAGLREVRPGRYPLRCGSCSARARIRRHVHALDELDVDRRRAKVAKLKAAAVNRLAKWRRSGPRSEAFKAKVGRGLTLAVRVASPFHFCPLCEFVLMPKQWHGVCWRAWRRARGRPAWDVTRPPRMEPRGRPANPTHVLQSYRWLMQRLAGASHKDLRESASTVTHAIRRLSAYLPGDWNLVFTDTMLRSGNRHRQALYPLPASLELDLAAPIGKGERDLKVLRLHCCTMADEDVAHITGELITRVRLVIAHYASAPPDRRAFLTGLPVEIVRRADQWWTALEQPQASGKRGGRAYVVGPFFPHPSVRWLARSIAAARRRRAKSPDDGGPHEPREG